MSMCRKSLILSSLTLWIGRLRDLFSGSRTVAFLSRAESDAEALFRRGRLRTLSDAESGHNAWQYRFRRACLQDMENSMFLSFYKYLLQKIMQTAVFSFGLFGLLYGVFSALLGVAGWLGARGGQGVLVSIFCSLAAIPLLSSGSSLGQVIRKSLFAELVLFGFCGISRDIFQDERVGENRNWLALFGAVLAATLGKWLPLSLFLVALSALFLLGIFIRTPELLTLGILLFLPFFSLFEHASLLLCAVVLLADFAWLWKAVCGRRRLRFGWIDFIFLSFACLMLFGGLFSAGGIDSAQSGWIRFALLTFWFPTTDFFTQNLWRKRGIYAMKCSGFLASVWGIGQYYLSDLELFWVDVSRFSDIGGRVCGPFSNPNIFAVFLVLVAPLFFAGTIDATRRIGTRLCNGIGFLSVALCTVFTWSRGAWLGLLASLLLILLSHSRTSFAVLLLSVLPVGVLSSFLPHSVINRFSSIGSFSESSIRYRFYTWKGVFGVIKDFPWGIGVGESSFSAVYPQYALSGIESVMHAHQLLLQILLEIGLPGGLLFLFFLFQLFLCVCDGLKRLHGGARAELLGCAGSVVGVLVMGLFDYVWYHLGMFCLFFVFCNLVALKRETEDSAYEKSIYL